MRPWELISTATVPGDEQVLRLYQRGDEFSIKVGHSTLMNSRTHGSEDALAELACQRLKNRSRAKVLIGGLGMGFTLATALQQLRPDAQIVVAEVRALVDEGVFSLPGAASGTTQPKKSRNQEKA